MGKKPRERKTPRHLLRDFNAVWDKLAEDSACDGRGGAEYRRVRAEWVAERCPFPISAFIRLNANRPPSLFPAD